MLFRSSLHPDLRRLYRRIARYNVEMRKLFSGILFVLALVWLLMAIFKIYLALSGQNDAMGRTPANHFVSGSIQGLLAFGAYKWAAYLRRPKAEQSAQ
jgi:hypothetical protein